MTTETGDNTDEERDEIALKRETDKARADRVERSWQAVVRTPEGRAVLWDIMDRLGMMASPMAFGQPDRTVYNIGRADAARVIYTKVGDYPRHLLNMEKENMR